MEGAFQFMREADAVASLAELDEITSLQVHRAGFERFKLMASVAPGSDTSALFPLAGGWPTGWLARYQRQNYAEHDPAFQRVFVEGLPTIRSLVMSAPDLSPMARRIAAEEREFGIPDFLSVPVMDNGKVVAVFCVSGPTELLLSLRSLEIALIAPVIDRNARRLMQGTGADPKREDFGLTARELECLEWTANGKTSWEIGEILAVSEHTVTGYLKNALVKLKVNTRTQAVATALRIGLFK
jgi:LuxR family quorum sensing-dependent transcriptional regulator